jgi:hypothetical protein
MGVEHNQFGEECNSSKQDKGEEICMGSYDSFRQSSFWHEQQTKNKKESLELEQPWRVNYRAC